MLEIHQFFELMPGDCSMAAFAIPFNRTMRIFAAGLRPGGYGEKYQKNQEIFLIHGLIPFFDSGLP